MLYAHIDFEAAIDKQRNNNRRTILQVVEWFLPNADASQLESGISQFEFGMLAWQLFQGTSFVCDVTLNSSYSAIV